MNLSQDTIAAQSTAPGTGAIHLIRLSGNAAIEIADKLFRGKKPLAKAPSSYVNFGRIYADEHLIDEVLATVFRAPDSYTGEDIVEISCHGNQYIADLILENILQTARLAKPGEFTQRAFINNKLDLTQAEAVGDLLAASTRHSHKIALDQLEGRLEKKIRVLLDKITELRLRLELEIDFPEDYVETISTSEMTVKIAELKEELQLLVQSGRDGLILREGYKVCLVGKPNVGKSSIFNALLNSARAIVTPIPGTTRDYLAEAIALEGFLLIFYDTAGLRETDDQLEKLGMERSLGIINQSDLIIYVTDSEPDEAETSKLEKLIEEKKIIKVLNKTDILGTALITKYLQKGYISCSTVANDGLSALKSRILQEINIKPEEFELPPLTNARQIAAARKALTELEQVEIALTEGVSIEFIAFDLLQVSKALEEITGLVTTDDILDKIFSGYCIGK
ncbi:MAG: tRNA uridine-5-carboxymethylaminomethyl(34) synthesis GTPase MnmE [Candidatus Cloacimonetes bacterium]|nr:tRNA uridine-5-carboxymethylaminomethyl(34) synthesis GTPase MnmE [Candidatus Cloacimonadota bacterium]